MVFHKKKNIQSYRIWKILYETTYFHQKIYFYRFAKKKWFGQHLRFPLRYVKFGREFFLFHFLFWRYSVILREISGESARWNTLSVIEFHIHAAFAINRTDRQYDKKNERMKIQAGNKTFTPTSHAFRSKFITHLLNQEQDPVF